MKTLFLVRHAKSSWKNEGQKDIDRPLNSRGERNALEMGNRLRSAGIQIDQFVSSPATRAQLTAQQFAECLGMTKDKIQIEDRLYFQGYRGILDTVHNFNNEVNSAILFSHNPSIEQFFFDHSCDSCLWNGSDPYEHPFLLPRRLL